MKKSCETKRPCTTYSYCFRRNWIVRRGLLALANYLDCFPVHIKLEHLTCYSPVKILCRINYARYAGAGDVSLEAAAGSRAPEQIS